MLPKTQSIFSAGRSFLWCVAYQTLGGDLCAITAHRGGDGSCAGSDLRLEAVLESVCQRVGGRCGGCVRGSNAELVDSSCPVVLVVMLRDEDLRRAGSRRR